jgi:hypothetical protein
METNYELKHKCLLVPLKAVLLVLVMLLVGFTTYAQSGKSVRVANNEQLTEAMQNPAIGTIELAAGYYAYLNYQSEDGTKVVKAKSDNGNRDAQCTYFIIGSNVCFDLNPVPPSLFPGYVQNVAEAGFVDANAPPCNCCPPAGSNLGEWTVISGPGNVIFYDPIGGMIDNTKQSTDFYVDQPGEYLLRYTWPAPYTSLVETKYYFYGPLTVDLSAPDVCWEPSNPSTTVTFTLSSAYPNPLTTVDWFLNGVPIIPPPLTASGTFDLTVPACGLYVLGVFVDPKLCPPVYEEITIDFSCMPIADAAGDYNVCGDLCAYLDGSVSVAVWSPTYAYSWYQVSGPGTLTFLPDPFEMDVQACIPANPPCSYGEYLVEFQVQNGQCYDEDDAYVRFYEQPLADAGPAQNLCNIFSFNLAAVPYLYCGVEGTNFWSENHWEIVSYPAGVTVTVVDPTSPTSAVNITGVAGADCAYGPYEFRWVENNSKGPGMGGCTDDDNVIVTIYEDPAPNAGNDQVFCDTWAFSIWGIGDEPCYDNTVVVYSWEKTDQPGDCLIQFSDLSDINPDVVISGCDPAVCPYGEYIFTLTQSNGYLDDNDNFVEVCSGSDEVSYWIFEPVDADAGPDQHICDNFAFTLTAVPTPFCGVAGTNFFTWGEWVQVSGPKPATIATAGNYMTGVTITDLTGCPYGLYQFMWTEYNGFGTPFQGCTGYDIVDIYIDEVPESVDAGPDQALCNMFEFALDGSVDMPCTQLTAYSLTWELVSQPDARTVTINTPNDIDPSVSITGTGGCPFGEYVFKLTQRNGYYIGTTGEFVEVCSDFDLVSVWIFEAIDADAGLDQHLCNDFEFDLTATPTPFCGVAGVNYFTSGEWVQIGGPKPATIAAAGNYTTGVTITDLTGCPWGAYTFRWTEKNGFYNPGAIPSGWCEGYDDVTVYVYEQPDVNAGNNAAYCETSINGQGNFMFQLDGTIDELCTGLYYQILWEVYDQPGTCDVSFQYDNSIDPMVTISNCAPCEYGEYIFKVTQKNGYYNDLYEFITVCEDFDYVSVWIYEQPVDVSAGIDQLLCNDYTFDLTAVGYDYCGDFGVNYNNWYSWTLVSQPAGAGCTVTITNGTTLNASVVVDQCTGACPYGEFKFRFTEYNGDANVYCEDWDEVSVFIFEEAVAEAGADIDDCVDIDLAPYCYDMTGSMDYCYSMYGVWTKSCGPGLVSYEDPNDPKTEICVDEPGRYKFTWSVWNGSENCEDEDEVILDLVEQPTADGEFSELYAPCDALCIDLGLAGIDKYEYFGDEWTGDPVECPNYWDNAYWELIDGPGAVTFTDDTDPETELCVSTFGGYTVRWNEVNKSIDGVKVCDSFFDVYVEFNETPVPQATGGEICGTCFTLDGTLDGSFGTEFYWELLPGGNCPIAFDPFDIDPEVCIDDVTECYGLYTFVLHQFNGECEGTATATILFKEVPDAIPVCFYNSPNDCSEFADGGLDFTYSGCLLPNTNDVLEVCAEGYTNIFVGPNCDCLPWPGFDWFNPLFFGYTFEWSLISPAGTLTDSQSGYYDFENGYWVYPYIYINWGECCDTARLYLTITAPNGCENTMEYKFYVYHKPCIDIVGPDVSEVGMLTTYCNDCPPNPCLLYDWTAEHCGHIVDGQGTPCIDVLWDSYNVNGGWGQITLTVFDTCTGCCNYDEMPVKIYPTGTLGNATLSGYVYYHNNSNTPLNGVEVQLWNNGIPVMSTLSFNDIEGGNGMGYYEFTGINGLTPFGVTASYDAPWYGANATDALAVELKTINNLPGGFIYDDVVAEAMDVNNINGINGTDALWIKQRAINMVNFFPAGNWAFDPTMATTAVVGYDIFALNMGDANRSNIPASMKSAPAIDLVNSGTMNVVTGQVFELPIRIAKADIFGAITLNLEYNPALIEVVDVASVEGMLSNITNGNVSMAWSNTNPMTLVDNDVVVTLKVKAISEIAAAESIFSIGLGSEFADPVASVIEPVTLKTFGITTAPAALDYFLSANRPNPFNTSTFIEYTMPETGKVKLSVLDMLGQEIAVLVESTQTAGSYTVEFSAAGLATGVYIYKFTVDGETRDFISTQRMVISH